MKREWIRPEAISEEFVANEYVSACVVGTLQCAIPGRSATAIDGSYPTRYGSDGLLHGLCGNVADVSFNRDTGEGTGYERDDNGNLLQGRPISGVSVKPTEPGIYNNVTWHSTDGSTGVYTHTGRLTVTYIDETRPNHS